MDAFWIIATGCLVAISCSLCGCFLVLRRMALLGDAISHAVLPGIVLAFLVSGSRSSVPMLIGAAAFGLLTAAGVQWLHRGGRVQSDAAIGVTFTALFAFGVVLVSLFAGHVDLDQECVLYGEIAYVPLDLLRVGDYLIGPRAFWQMLAVLILCGGVIGAAWKELKLTSFDPDMAAAVGINVALVHYILMALVSAATVGSFELVGAILVVAMLVVPAATAYLLTDELGKMMGVAAIVGVVSTVLGYGLALVLDASPAGAISVAAGFLFSLALLLSPSHGIVPRAISQRRLSQRIGREDALQMLWRRAERGETLDALGLAALTRREIGAARATLNSLARAGLATETGKNWTLSETGRQTAQDLMQRHRVYESYLGELGYATDHVHDAADRTDHFLSPDAVRALSEAAGNPARDPQGKEIPQ
ncbi:MAG TPA: metal ABC transporter permease [Abditibacteriaceae bacterium]|jgi:manganese/zinc/iron transport system permease protein